MRTAEYRLSQVRVGLFVAVCGIILTGSILYFGIVGSPFSQAARIHAEFDNVYGLAEGSPVEMGGVSIGQIESIELPNVKTGLVPVTLSIRPDALSRLGPSTRAFTSSHALVGQRFVGLSVRKEGEMALTSGATVKTEASDALDTVMAEARRTFEHVDAFIADSRQVVDTLNHIVNEVDAGHGTIGRLARDEKLYNSLNAAVNNTRRLTDEMTSGRGAIGSLVGDAQLGQQVRDSVSVLSETAQKVHEGKGVLGRLTNDEAEAERIDRTLANIDRVTTNLADAKGGIGALINDPTMRGKVTDLLNQLDALLLDVRRNPQRYLKISAF